MKPSKAGLPVMLVASLFINGILLFRISQGPTEIRLLQAETAPQPAGSVNASEDSGTSHSHPLKSPPPGPSETEGILRKTAEAHQVSLSDIRASQETGREDLRRLLSLLSDPLATTPEATLEIGERILAIKRVILNRAKDPASYSDVMMSLFSLSLSEPTLTLSDAQAERLTRVLSDTGHSFSKIAALPPAERLLENLKAEASTFEIARSLLSEPQWQSVKNSPLLPLVVSSGSSAEQYPKEGASQLVLSAWTLTYQLDPAQQTLASEAAEVYVRAVSALGGDAAQDASSSAGYAYRIAAAREQAFALRILESGLTPAQREKMRSVPMREFLLYDDSAGSGTATRSGGASVER